MIKGTFFNCYNAFRGTIQHSSASDGTVVVKITIFNCYVACAEVEHSSKRGSVKMKITGFY